MRPEDEIIARFGLLLSALFIWLAVRLINRRERWSKRTAIALAVLLSIYLLSFGPACWWIADRSFGYYYRMAPICYWPIGRIALRGPEPIRNAICWYAKAGNSESLLIPAEWGGHEPFFVR
jgi:hypothetical protein